jgi:hypothetical protein
MRRVGRPAFLRQWPKLRSRAAQSQWKSVTIKKQHGVEHAAARRLPGNWRLRIMSAKIMSSMQ